MIVDLLFGDQQNLLILHARDVETRKRIQLPFWATFWHYPLNSQSTINDLICTIPVTTTFWAFLCGDYADRAEMG